MYQHYRKLRERREAGEIDGGFTLIELLIVIVVLGILAAIVVFALGSVTGKSAAAACQSDARTVGTGVAAMIAENSQEANSGMTTALWETDMVASSTTSIVDNASKKLVGNPFIQTWPSSSSYVVWVGDGITTAAVGSGVSGTVFYSITGTGGSAALGTASASSAVSTYGDVYVTGLGSGSTGMAYTYDATTDPVEGCMFAVTGHG